MVRIIELIYSDDEVTGDGRTDATAARKLFKLYRKDGKLVAIHDPIGGDRIDGSALHDAAYVPERAR